MHRLDAVDDVRVESRQYYRDGYCEVGRRQLDVSEQCSAPVTRDNTVHHGRRVWMVCSYDGPSMQQASLPFVIANPLGQGDTVFSRRFRDVPLNTRMTEQGRYHPEG